MSATILEGDVMLRLKDFQDARGRFKKGTHWRAQKPYWDRSWLYDAYVVQGRSSADIAKEFGCYDSNILYFLSKFRIKTRSMSETRRLKDWGLSGSKNLMFGRTGKLNPRWNGGHSPERQSAYARHFWKELAKSILLRDNYKCQNCGSGHTSTSKLEVHHIKPWSAYPELRFTSINLITLCHSCHLAETRKGVKAN